MASASLLLIQLLFAIIPDISLTSYLTCYTWCQCFAEIKPAIAVLASPTDNAEIAEPILAARNNVCIWIFWAQFLRLTLRLTQAVVSMQQFHVSMSRMMPSNIMPFTMLILAHVGYICCRPHVNKLRSCHDLICLFCSVQQTEIPANSCMVECR